MTTDFGGRTAGRAMCLGVALLLIGWPGAGLSAGPAIAVFPFQDLSFSRNDINLSITGYVSSRLADAGAELSEPEMVIKFLANNRIRNPGHLEMYQVSKVREDLGAAFVLLGTITETDDRRHPCIGMTLSLIRTSDARTVWSYVGDFSAAASRQLLGLGEPDSVASLQPLLADDLLSAWPWDLIGPALPSGPIGIVSNLLEPRHVRPGEEVRARVRIHRPRGGQGAPRAFFKADDQLHAAEYAVASGEFYASWVAGEEDGRFAVSLILEWPQYGRKEEARLGTYKVDGLPPMPVMQAVGADEIDDTPLFRDELVVQPRLLISKPLARWHLEIMNEAGDRVAQIQDQGQLPERFYWWGQGKDRFEESNRLSDGVYDLRLRVWDQAGNSADTSLRVVLRRGGPRVRMLVDPDAVERVVELESGGKLPLSAWRMELWSEEGRLLKTVEGTDLSGKVRLGMQDLGETSKVRGILVVRDVLGATARHEVEDLFQSEPKPEPKPEPVREEKPKGAARKWVDEF